MKFLSFILFAIMASSGVANASLSQQQQKSNHLLFNREERRTPVELFTGEDPQLEMVKREREKLKGIPMLRRGHLDYFNVEEHAPVDLQKRQTTQISPGTGTAYPPPGANSPPVNTLPKAWVDKYNAVKQAGLIPDIPVSVLDTNGLNQYPAGTDMTKVCSWTVQKCYNGDIYQAPNDMVAFGIDDGPTPDGTPKYVQIFKDESISATHFLIGSTITWNPDAMNALINATPKQNLGIHTWSHTLMTTKTDLEIVGELGWTAQLIYDKTGLIPIYCRFPQGDVDNRVRAIMKYVWGMESVLWTHDANDWCLRENNGTASEVQTCVQTAPDLKTVESVEVGWASPKTSSTGWITLNHETTDQASIAFQAMVKAAKQAGWTIAGAIPNLQGLPWYSNAFGPNDTPAKQDNILPIHSPINITDGTAAKGSTNAPTLGNWAKNAAASQPSSSGGSGQHATGTTGSGNKTTSGSKSSAMAISVNSVAITMAVISVVFALTA